MAASTPMMALVKVIPLLEELLLVEIDEEQVLPAMDRSRLGSRSCCLLGRVD